MATYYIGADVHSNNTELAIEKRGKIMARYSVPIDATKLAVLLRGNFLKAVYHSDDSNRAHLKHWVNLYHDRVRDAVRNINKIRACCMMHGIAIPRKVVRNNVHRHDWLSGLDNPVLKAQLQMLWIGYDGPKVTRSSN